MYYPDYLHLDDLLECQVLESAKQGTPAHDEMLFIIVHQAYELWFKQILWELEAVLSIFAQDTIEEREVGRVVAHLDRITVIQNVLIDQIDVLETMTPLDFLDFRDDLVPASGFQSVQFRLIENKLGLRPEDRLQVGEGDYRSRFAPEHREQLAASERAPSLVDRIERWLERTPFLQFGAFDFWKEYRQAVDEMLARDRQLVERNPTLTDERKETQLRQLDATAVQFEALFDREKYTALVEEGEFRFSHQALQATLLINLYRDEPILHVPFRLLTLLMDVDEHFVNWRYRHALMVLRMIGAKIGTGGSSGHDYLRETAEQYKVFADLFKLSTFFIPRSALPELPEHVRQAMGFRFDASTT